MNQDFVPLKSPAAGSPLHGGDGSQFHSLPLSQIYDPCWSSRLLSERREVRLGWGWCLVGAQELGGGIADRGRVEFGSPSWH